LWILLLAYVTIELPAAYQQLQAAFRSLAPELEEASRILGASRLRTLRDITAPLLGPSLVATWCFVFVAVVRELSAAVILFTSETKVLSVLIFDLKESGDLAAIAVLGLTMLILTATVIIAANRIPAFDAARLPAAVSETCERLLVDIVGLCVVARGTAYVQASLAAWADPGPATAIGHPQRLSAAGAAFINGTAAHGEDFDDTFEGGPIHAGAVIVPAVLAACERHKPEGGAALLGIAVGVETMCRLSLVAPTLTHKAGFHPPA